jgi:hypothetical protein
LIWSGPGEQWREAWLCYARARASAPNIPPPAAAVLLGLGCRHPLGKLYLISDTLNWGHQTNVRRGDSVVVKLNKRTNLLHTLLSLATALGNCRLPSDTIQCPQRQYIFAFTKQEKLVPARALAEAQCRV